MVNSEIVAEIKKCYNECLKRTKVIDSDYWNAKADAYRNVLVILNDTLKVKEVDLEREIDNWICDNAITHEDCSVTDVISTAKHFFELGLKAQKGEREMVTIKSYTDIEQSKKLAEILPIESADNLIVSIGYNDGVKTVTMPKATLDIINTPFSDIRKTIPCWSLSALLNVLPDGTDIIKEEADTENERYMCTIGINDDIISTFANNPVNACVEMIEKLHNLKML